MNIRLCALFCSALAVTSTAAAAQNSTASPIVYNLKLGAGAGSGMDVSMTLAVKSMASDGSRAASLVVKAPIPPLNGKQVDATISPAGAITIGSTGDVNAHYSPMQAKAASQAAIAPLLQMMLGPLNTFAAACGAAPSLKAGTVWHAFWNEGQTNLIYTVTGAEQLGHRDTVGISVTSLSGSGPSMTGHGNYDPVAHLVVNLHTELKQSAQGPASQVTDVSLGDQ